MKLFYRFLFILLSLTYVVPAFSQNRSLIGNIKDIAATYREKARAAAINNPSEAVVVHLIGNQSLKLKINFSKTEGTAELFFGEVQNTKSSRMYLKILNGEVTGSVVMHQEKKFYRYSSTPDGAVYLTEEDINKVLCIEYQEKVEQNAASGIAGANNTTAPPVHESLPGAGAVLYLDFDGQTVTNTVWNNQYTSGAPIVAEPSTLANHEILEVWRMVSEDFRPFNLNVTTSEAVFNNAPINRRMRIIFTPTKSWFPGNYGGVAYIGSFTWGGSGNGEAPCWVWNTGGKAAGETGSHEAGHTLGLRHDGRTSPSETYYYGHNSWAPIMGASFNAQVTQWSKGEYPYANNTEDDLHIIATFNGFSYRPDDHGNTIATATPLVIEASGDALPEKNKGIITTSTDVDVFSFQVPSGGAILSIYPDLHHPNLDIRLTLHNSAGFIIAVSDPYEMSASVRNLQPGSYFITIDGGAGYLGANSDYSSLGAYTISLSKYCLPVYSEGCLAYSTMITGFNFNTLSNNYSGCTSSNANSYTNYPPTGSNTTSVYRGQSYGISMQSGMSNGMFYGVWIDYNNDGDFDDSGEFVFSTTTRTTNTVVGSVTIPANAALGAVRMRVRSDYYYIIHSGLSCSSMFYGEAEDYTITIIDNIPPTVSITSPSVNSVAYIAPADVYITATASDADGTVTKVEFYNGAMKVGEDLTAPYEYSWFGVPAGNYTFTAKAFDNVGATTTSNTVSVMVTQAVTYYLDADGDGFGNRNISQQTSFQPVGYVTNNTDCNDSDNTIYPGAPELCDGKDNDCNGIADDMTSGGGIVATWNVTRQTGNPLFSLAATNYSEASQFIPSPIKLSNGDVWVYVMGHANNRIYGYKSTNGGTSFTLQGVAVDKGTAGTWDDAYTTMPYALYDEASNTIHLYYSGGQTSSSNSSLGHATASGFSPMSFSKDAANPMVSPASFMSKMGISHSYGLSLSSIIKKDGVFHFHGTYVDDSWTWKLWRGIGSSLTNISTAATTLSPASPSTLVQQPSIFKIGATYYMIYTTGHVNTGEVNERWLQTAYSSDLINWTQQSTALLSSSGEAPAGWESKRVLASGLLKTGTGNYDSPVEVNGKYLLYYSGTNFYGSDQGGLATISPATFIPGTGTNQQLTTFYRDADADGYGTAYVSIQACSAPTGYVLNNTDCNDNDNTIHPGRTEICDGKDNNCNGTVDEVVKTTYYRDADNDGYGNAAVSMQSCSAPAGYVTNSSDCNDSDNTVYPGAQEVCDNKDNNCNGVIDEQATKTYYQDSDGDGFGNPVSMLTVSECTILNGYVWNNTDCNDNDNSIYPGAPELCDGKDNNCNGITDEGVKLTFYRDADNDGYGNASVTVQACSPPSGYVINNSDCDDSNAAINPHTIWYMDVDNDGYYMVAGITSCTSPGTGFKYRGVLAGDCNDSDNTIYPGATELCDGKDNNCNGTTDEGVKTTYYRDADGDGYGNASASTQACSAPAGYVTNSTDCNDSDITVYPNAPELCDGKDNNCNGSTDEGVKTTYYRDTDGDGFGNSAVTTQACSVPSGYVTNSTDCNDNDSSIYPNAPELCDAKDNNCNGTIDEGCSTKPTITINDIEVYESVGTAVLTVTLSNAAATPIEISYTTVDGTAISKGSGRNPQIDFNAAKGTLIIPAGSLTGLINVTILNDGVVESTEFFDMKLTLAKTANATLSKGTGRVTILNGSGPATTKGGNNEIAEEFNTNQLLIQAFPNPTSDAFTVIVNSNLQEKISVRIYDLNGRLVQVKNNLSAGQVFKFGTNYRNGSYYLVAVQGKQRQTVKLIKMAK